MRHAARLLPLLLIGCSEYDLSAGKDPAGGGEDSGDVTGTDGDTDGGDTEVEEICNGEDDDGDGQVDEGFEDIDGDGVADCVDDDCDADAPAGGFVGVVAECLAYDPGEVADPWDLSVEWQNTSVGTSVSMPAVGNLTDDNGDGVVNEDDVPDIAITLYGSYGSGGSGAAVLSGDGTRVHFTAPDFRYDSGVSIADVDGDGAPELVGPRTDGRVQSYSGSGVLEWVSADSFTLLYPISTVADVDGDGMPEVIADTAVVSGLDGHTVARLSPLDSSAWRSPVVADLDQDGYAEIVLSNTVFDAAGNVLWSASGYGTSCFSALVEMDGDPEAEVAFAYGNALIFHEHDGTFINQVPLPGYYGHPGPPCVGDLDGDGDAEIAVPEGSQITAFELDGSQMWSVPINDSSGAAGCSVYDMNNDGSYEIIFADMNDLIIFDGATGARQYENPAHGSVTYFEYPVVADIDQDGSAEIITASSGYSGYSGVTVFGHNGDGWPAAGPTWPVHDFALTNVDPDGSVPANPLPSWTTWNVFRGRPSADYAGQPDLFVEINDVCLSACEDDGTFKFSYQLGNQGEGDVAAGSTSLRVWMIDGAGNETLWAETPIPAVPSGSTLDAETVVLTLAELGEGGFILRVDDDGTGLGLVPECDETNNEDAWREGWCN